MRPVSNNAFSDVLITYMDSLWDSAVPNGMIDAATMISLLNIGHFVDPKRNKPDKFENFIEDMVLRMYENTSTIMKLKKYLKFKLKEWPESEKAVWWKIGERWEIQETGEKGNCYYPDAKSFLENVDYNFSVQIIKKCWKRACSTGELFPEDEAIKDCAKNHMNGWILD